MKCNRITATILAGLLLTACDSSGTAGKPTGTVRPTGSKDQAAIISGAACTAKVTPGGFEVQVGSGSQRHTLLLTNARSEDVVLGSNVKAEQSDTGSRLIGSEPPSGKDIFGSCFWNSGVNGVINWSFGSESFAEPTALQICALEYYNGIIAVHDTTGKIIPIGYRNTQRVLVGHEIPFQMNDGSIEPLPKGGPFDTTQCYDQSDRV